MKRHTSLAPISREHHTALLLAQLLKKDAPPYKDMPETPREKSAYALQFFRNNLQAHFSKEEKMLTGLRQYHTAIAALALEVQKEHVELTELFNKLDMAENLAAAMDAAGRALEKHIRKEERVLFPLIQEHCPEDVLNTIEW
jgi:iron-sulfur cluster repair protein YtfE (RIC family)